MIQLKTLKIVTLALALNAPLLHSMESYSRIGTKDPESQEVHKSKRKRPCSLIECLKGVFWTSMTCGTLLLGWQAKTTLDNANRLMDQAKRDLSPLSNAIHEHRDTMRNVDHVANHIDDLFHNPPNQFYTRTNDNS